MRLLTLLLALTAIPFTSSSLFGEVSESATYSLPETDDVFDSYAYNAAGWAWEPFSANLVEAGDLFKIIEGLGLPLERTNWAGIRTTVI